MTNLVRFAIVLWIACILALYALASYADPLAEERYVKVINRDIYGHIARRADVLAAFKKIHPCPSTGKSIGACKGWQINHIIPLACFGLDGVSNLGWFPTVIKTGWQDYQIDRWERLVYARPDTNSIYCKNKIVIITDPLYSN